MGNIVPVSAQVESKQGEILVTINLNLNIKVDQDGSVSVGEEEPMKSAVFKMERPPMVDNSEIINFGKQVN